MLPLLLAATPAWAQAQPTNMVAAVPTVTAQAAAPHLESSSKLEHNPDATSAPAKKHWWTRFKFLFKGGPSGKPDEIMQYQGLSSRPWSAISADPPYMSNWQDCRVHHPNFGIGGSY
ncbi:MAG: hypothetical protein P4N60_16675 [Verrucomicrobiae bacterium]|nr:hypothetical protein [Verrucomicrobiae bacterium]